MGKATLLSQNKYEIEEGMTIALSDSVQNFDAIFLQFWVTIYGGASRKFCNIDTQMPDDVGSANRYIESSVYYSNDYNAAVGICYPNKTSLTIKEKSLKGYEKIYLGKVYGFNWQ